jgi:hypothetical protein
MAMMLNNDMPMSLDNNGGDMVDLFGDATGLPLPQASKQLESRLDWLRCRGCCKCVKPLSYPWATALTFTQNDRMV